MDIKKRLTNTTAMRYFEWFADPEAFIFPPKDDLDAAMRQAKHDMRAQKVRNRGDRIKQALSDGQPILNVMKEMREDAVKDAKVAEIVGFQFKDW